MNSSKPPPLVSVIVRTMGRPELRRALESVAAQSHRPLELVLVDAAGSGISAPALHGIPVTLVGGQGRLDRAAAANAGMAAARGDWVGFLDEDDEHAPGHVASLLAVALASGAHVAYGQTRMVDRAGNTVRIFGGGPFNRAALLRSNYIAVHATLFRRDLFASGARFDGAMDGFEDWDFWLQLSAKGDFAFNPSPTAIYHAEAGTSGSGGGSNLDREAALARRDRLMKKWLARNP